MTTFLDDLGSSGDPQVCPAELALLVMRGRWKLMIVRELEADAVVWRRVFSEVPPRVEYGLTERGQALLPVLDGLHAWGAAAPPGVEAGE